MRIRVVMNRPECGQDDIGHLIGREYDCESADEDGQYPVNEPNFGGIIRLNPSEVIVLKY